MRKKALIAAAVIILAAAAVIYFACAPKSAGADFFAMDTYMNFTVKGRDADKVAARVKSETGRLDEEVLSRQRAGSEVYLLNKNHGGKLGAELGKYISSLLDVYEKSGGKYDFTLGAVSDLWGFGSNPSVPGEAELKAALKKAGADKLALSGNNIAIPQGAVIDFGSAGKGIVLDEVKAILDESAVKEAVMSAGGSILVYGSREFTVGIKDPQGGSGYIAVLHVPQCCVSTSGSYERYFESEGKRYHHILD
ncbi:MAG: FAD:protein FMN transferase, partial [Clostridia bacterium]|nr:FAD:protein FMN transferase [Clostridia bacterium]